MPITRLKDISVLPWVDPNASGNSSGVYLINVKEFGVIGNGVTDDTIALQAAFNSKNALYFPPGNYIASADITLPVLDTDSAIYVGAGMTESRILFTHTGNGFVGPNGRTDHFVFQDISIENTNGSNTGNGFTFTGASDVQTRVQLFRVKVSGWNGWGYFSYNTQSSQIQMCHFRSNTKGHIAFEDDNVGEFSREPNANQIISNLLDNSSSNAANVAVIRLFNSNGSVVWGNTLQGQWVGGGGNDPAIFVESCRGVSIKGNHIEAGSSVSAAGILIKNSQGTIIENGTGSGLHTKDIELQGCKGTIVFGGCYINDVPHLVVDSNCRETYVIGGRYLAPANITNNDSSPDGVTVIGVTYHSQTSTAILQIDKWIAARELASYDHFENGDFTNDTAYWTGSATGISRVATGSPPDDGPYVLCNTQGLGDGGQVGGSNFKQTWTVPDSYPASAITIVFQYYIENFFSSSSDPLRFVDVEFSGSGLSGSTVFRIPSSPSGFQSGGWYQAKITDTLSTGTSRTVSVNINPTQGPKTPKVRFSKFHLYQGKEQILPDGAVALLNKTNSFWKDQYIDVAGSSTGTPRVFGMGHKNGNGLQTGEAARFLIGDAFNAFQSSNSGVMVVQSFHAFRFYGHTFGGNTGSEAPIGFFTNNTSDPHHEFFTSNGGFSVNVSDNPNIRTVEASNSTSSHKHIQGMGSDRSTEKFAIMQNGSYRISGNQIIGARKTGWSTPTGTLQRTDYAVYSAPTISIPPTTLEVQNLANALQDVSRELKALITDLHASTSGHGLVGN